MSDADYGMAMLIILSVLGLVTVWFLLGLLDNLEDDI